MKLRKSISLVSAVILTCGLISGCSNKNTKNQDSNLEKVTVVLDWTPNTNHTVISW